MKKILGIVCIAIECFLFLWLVVGLWACANKIRDLEEEQKSIIAFNRPDDQTKRLVMALNSMQHETDMLRINNEDTQHSIDLLAFRVTDLESNSPGKEYHMVNGKVEECMPWEDEIARLETRIEELKLLHDRVKELEEHIKYQDTLVEWRLVQIENMNQTNNLPSTIVTNAVDNLIQ